MKKDFFIRVSLLVILFSLTTLVKGYYSQPFQLVWFCLGGLAGSFLPDVDHLLYVFVFRPLDISSQRVSFYLKNKQYKEALRFLYDTRFERGDLIFHSLNFVIIFGLLTFWVTSSSGSFFGNGLVLGFWLHLTIDYFKKYKFEPIVIGMVALLLVSAILL